jgi:outer membrane receptor protein involved in Fe transport
VRFGRFEISAGLRANYFRYGDVSTWRFDPRTVVRFRLFEGVKLKAATGLFSEPPLPFQLTRGAANPKLAPQRAWQNSVGAELQLPAALEIDTTLFYSAMYDIARSSGQLQQDENGNVARPFFESDGRGRAYGWELMLRRRAEKGLFGWISYTLSRSERFLEGGDSVVFAFDQTHVLNLALSYAVSGWTFGARFTLATGRPVGDILDPTGRTKFDADEDDFDPDSGGKTTRLPTFHQLDVRIDRDFVLGRVRGSVYLDVINVYNSPNSEGWRYSYNFTQRGRVPGLPLLPTIGVRAMFE